MNNPLHRHRHIIDFAISSLFRRKIKNLSLLVLYTLIVFVVASLIFYVQSLKHEATLVLRDAPDMVVQRTMAGRHDLIPESYGGQIRAIRGVRQVLPRRWGYYYDAVHGANFTLLVPPENLPEAGTVRIGAGVARILGARQGDMIPLRSFHGQPLLLDVAQIFPADSELVASDLIILSPEDFQAMFNLPAGHATDLAVSVANPRELTTVAAKIAEQIPGSRPILKSEMLRTYDALFDWRGGMMIVVLSGALFAFVIFAWDKAAGLSAEERREIGILKSVGWETADVLLLKFWEGMVVSLTAFLLGLLLAYAHVFFYSATLFEHALKGWSVLYPRFSLTPVVDMYQLFVLFFLTVVPYTAATIIPSWLAATVDPDSAMRS